MSEESRSDDNDSSSNDRPSLSDVDNNMTFKGPTRDSDGSDSDDSDE